MYEYNEKDISEIGETEVYIVVSMRLNDSASAEQLCPDVYVKQSLAQERCKQIEENGKESVTAEVCGVSLSAQGSDQISKLYFVLYKKDESGTAELLTPEVYTSARAAMEKENSINDKDGMVADAYPLVLYNQHAAPDYL